MTILGIDPGLVQTGYGIIKINNNSKTVLDYGTITPSSKDNLSIRLSTIYHDLLLIIDKYLLISFLELT